MITVPDDGSHNISLRSANAPTFVEVRLYAGAQVRLVLAMAGASAGRRGTTGHPPARTVLRVRIRSARIPGRLLARHLGVLDRRLRGCLLRDQHPRGVGGLGVNAQSTGGLGSRGPGNDRGLCSAF